MNSSWDALVLGAGPAGCAAAYDLAAAGKRVLLLDRRSFPRHKACACGLTRKTLKALRYSVAPVLERECRDVVLQEAGAAFAQGVRRANKELDVRVRTRAPFCAMAVRERFDAFCLEQTLAQGAEFRKIEGLVSVQEFPDHVALEVSLGNGGSEVLHAPVVIGADGANGQMRRLAAGLCPPVSRTHDSGMPVSGSSSAAATHARAGAALTGRQVFANALPPEPAWYARGFALEGTVPFSDLPQRLPGDDGPLDLVFDFSPIAGGYGWLFPKGDHINIGVGGFVPQGSGAAAGVGGMGYESATRQLLVEYTRAKLGVPLPAHVTGQYLGLGGHAYVPSGRVLLVGDAAGLIDPLTGEGIHSAIVSGQAAAGALLGSEAGADVAVRYAEQLRPLQEILRFSHRAAASFYREPGRGFKVMRTPLLRALVLKTYAEGLPVTKLLTSLARRVA